MATAKEVVTDAQEDLLEQAAEEPIEQPQAQAGIRYLNDMMFAWDAVGISLGFTKIDNLGDPLTVPDGAIKGIKRNLSLELSAKYDVEPTQLLKEQAFDGLSAIMNLVDDIAPMRYDPNLPMGSGNVPPGYPNYYPRSAVTALTETGGSISLENYTEMSS